MARASTSVTVHRPIAEVFAFLSDGLNNPAWRPGVTAISLRAGGGVGAEYAQQMRGPGGRTIDGDYRVTVWESPTRLAFEVVAGPARPVGSFALRALGEDTTEVTFTLDLQPHGLMVLMGPMLARQVRAETANISNLPAAMSR